LSHQDRRVAARFLFDPTPLRRSRDFRYLFTAQTVSMVGNQLAAVAVAYQVFSLTRSSLQVGLVSLVQLVPFVVGSLAGGVVGDASGGRRLLIAATGLSCLTSGGLAVNAIAGSDASVGTLYILTATAAALSGCISTATTAMVPSLVGRGQLTPAYTTMQVVDQIGMVAGPILSGLVIAAFGLPWLYGIDAATFLWSALFLWRMRDHPRSAPRQRPRLGSLREGFAYVRCHQEIQGVYLIDLCATVFGLPRALFPALTRSVFHGGAVLLGVLYAAPAAGALVGSLTSGWLSRIRLPGRAVVVAVVVWGSAIVAFGFVRVVGISLVLLVVAGWSDLVSAVLRSTILQSSTSDALRARLSGVQMAVVEGGPRLGDLESGGVASLTSVQFSIVSGGVVCVVGALGLAALLPHFRRYRAAPPPSLE
jgi:hypothetical protein